MTTRERNDELLEELMPIAKSAMGVATERLQELEEKGYFAFGREAMGILDRIVERFEPEDVHQLGDNIVAILEAVRSVTQPKMLELAVEASRAIETADEQEPLGMMGALRATRDPDVQRGIAVVVAVLRELGRGAKQVSDRRSSAKERLASRIAPSAAKPVRAPAPPKTERRATIALEGVALDDEGFLIDPDAWNQELAVKMASSLGVGELSERHWRVVDYARATFKESGQSPNVRKLATGSGVSTKEIYELFKKAPGMSVARIAGIPKPVGCI